MIARQNPRIRPLVSYHGGKYYQCHNIIDLMPSHQTYVEPFIGGGSVFLNKIASDTDVISDLNEPLITLYRLLQSKPDWAQHYLEQIDYSESNYEKALVLLHDPTTDPEIRALQYVVVMRFSRGSLGNAFGWSDKLRRGMPFRESMWKGVLEETLPRVIARLKNAKIFLQNAATTISHFDSPETLIYCDPPYMLSTRESGSREIYSQEMSDLDHLKLSILLNTCKSKIMISGYANQQYSRWYKNWYVRSWKVPKPSSQTGGEPLPYAKEFCWCNFRIPGGIKSL